MSNRHTPRLNLMQSIPIILPLLIVVARRGVRASLLFEFEAGLGKRAIFHNPKISISFCRQSFSGFFTDATCL